MTIGDDIERRLDNWGRWYWSGRQSVIGSGCVVSSIYAGGPRGRRSDVAMPVLDGEAIETDDAVDRLPEDHRRALRARYLCVGPRGGWVGGMKDDQVAQRLGVSERTYQARLAEARRLLAGEIAGRRRRVQEQRSTPVA